MVDRPLGQLLRNQGFNLPYDINLQDVKSDSLVANSEAQNLGALPLTTGKQIRSLPLNTIITAVWSVQ